MGNNKDFFENDIPKYKKKSKKKGQPRADHKHEYQTVVLHSYFDNPFEQGVKNEHQFICKVCSICGRVGEYVDSLKYAGVNGKEHQWDLHGMEHWYLEDWLDKFAKRMGDVNEDS